MAKTTRERFGADRPAESAALRSKGSMARPRKSTAATSEEDNTARVVVRHCRVCEWKDQVVETTPGVDPDCPWCHGPTEADYTVELPAVAEETPSGKNPHAAALGRLGGIKGGHVRAQRLSAKRRREIASKAARARWNKR
jgi:hypothetical protein